MNPSDPICSEYIGYFEHREKMMAIGSWKLGKLAAQNAILSTILSASAAARGKDSDSEPLILVRHRISSKLMEFINGGNQMFSWSTNYTSSN